MVPHTPPKPIFFNYYIPHVFYILMLQYKGVGGLYIGGTCFMYVYIAYVLVHVSRGSVNGPVHYFCMFMYTEQVFLLNRVRY